MKIYFVRHGQSDIGEVRHQLPESPLSDQGQKEAEVVARRFKNIPVDTILSSSYTRALQTAEEIEKITSVPLLQNDLLVERKMPSQFFGKLIDDPKIVPIHQTIREHFFDPDFHHSDEENFADLLARVKSALDLISQQKENIVVVTHGYFLTVLIYVILFGEKEDPQTFKSFREHTANLNTGITLCEYKDGEWKLLTWNDIAHLEKE